MYLLQVKEIDSNLDGKMNGHYFSAVINKASATEIIFLTVVLMIDYTLYVRMLFFTSKLLPGTASYFLQTVCSLHMQSAIVLEAFINPLLTNFEASADLRLNQLAPLNCHHRFKNNHYNYSIIPANNKYNVKEMLIEYNKRNGKFGNQTTSKNTLIQFQFLHV